MGMSVGTSTEGSPMGEMNTTPLIDVMLVLLVMFIITLPVQTHAPKLDLPQGSNNPPAENQQVNVAEIRIDFLGDITWNGQPVTSKTLERRFLDVAADPYGEVHLIPDKFSRYEITNKVLAAAQRAGVTKIGFVGNEQYM